MDGDNAIQGGGAAWPRLSSSTMAKHSTPVMLRKPPKDALADVLVGCVSYEPLRGMFLEYVERVLREDALTEQRMKGMETAWRARYGDEAADDCRDSLKRYKEAMLKIADELDPGG